jgi:hypothetical protein
MLVGLAGYTSNGTDIPLLGQKSNSLDFMHWHKYQEFKVLQFF